MIGGDCDCDDSCGIGDAGNCGDIVISTAGGGIVDVFSISPSTLLMMNSDMTRCNSVYVSSRFNNRRVVRRSRITPRNGVDDAVDGNNDDDGTDVVMFCCIQTSSPPSSWLSSPSFPLLFSTIIDPNTT